MRFRQPPGDFKPEQSESYCFIPDAHSLWHSLCTETHRNYRFPLHPNMKTPALPLEEGKAIEKNRLENLLTWRLAELRVHEEDVGGEPAPAAPM